MDLVPALEGEDVAGVDLATTVNLSTSTTKGPSMSSSRPMGLPRIDTTDCIAGILTFSQRLLGSKLASIANGLDARACGRKVS